MREVVSESWRSLSYADDRDRMVRFLTSNSTDDDGGSSSYDDTEVLQGTFLVYGSALLLIFVVFCGLRRWFPKVYQLRTWVPDKTADDDLTPTSIISSSHPATTTDNEQSTHRYHGILSWIYDMYMMRDDQILRKCGMDALCFIRIAQFGYRLSIMGVFNAIWLVFVYHSAPEGSDTADIDDPVVEISIAHVPSGNWQRFLAVVLAAYIFFGYAMYLVLQDFQWYIHMRNDNIPSNYRNNLALEQFMKSCFTTDSVLEARVAVTTNQLTATQQKRKVVLAKLEHALAQFEITGTRPRHRERLFGSRLDSIEIYTSELDELNEQVDQEITAVENKITASLSTASSWNPVRNVVRAGIVPTPSNDPSGAYNDRDDMGEGTALVLHTNGDENGASKGSDESVANSTRTNAFSSAVGQFAAETVGQVGDALQTVGNFATDAVGEAAALITGKEDGENHTAGFVVFTKLSSTNAALQMVHHSTPFSMEITEAPDPKDINWINISRTHRSLQIGQLTSFALSVGLCLLWTIPMSFIATLSSVEGLRKTVPVVDDVLNDFPALVPVFEITAPLLVVVANSMLPTILQIVTLFEGPISNAVATASLFAKLSGFMVLQTFFVSAISGSIIAKLEEILDSPKLIVDLLANSLPSQSTYFIQISFVSIVVQCGMELLRVVPLGMAAVRSLIGPSLTQKERRTTFMGLRPLYDPEVFQHAYFTSQAVLYFMVLLVYSVIAPLTNFVLAFCFLFLGVVLRHQFLYVYPRVPDSGGKIWSHFIRIFLSCMLVAQITMLGLLGLKKAKVASPFFLPLVIVTALFTFYIRQQHFRVAKVLPSRNCLREDMRRAELDMSFLCGAYVQPELSAPRRVAPSTSTTAEQSQYQEVHRGDYQELSEG